MSMYGTYADITSLGTIDEEDNVDGNQVMIWLCKSTLLLVYMHAN